MTFRVYDRLSPSPDCGHLVLVTDDYELVTQFVDADMWRYEVVVGQPEGGHCR